MLDRLDVYRFRNLAAQQWAPGPGRHLIVGDNGAGKTSLIEALYLLATTRSFRTPQLADCCAHGESDFRLAGRLDGRRRADLELEWRRGIGTQRAVDGKRTSLADHLAVLPVLAWTAADADILAGPPAGRRRLLDRGLIGLRPASLDILARYRQTLGAKRQLLLAGANADAIAPWNALLATSGAELIARRQAYVEILGRAFETVLAASGLGFPPIRLSYRSSPADGGDGPAVILSALADAALEERRARRPLIGPHRDDLIVRWGGRPLRRVASAGERKALGLVLVAAQGKVLGDVERAPIFLLDDADTELDALRLGAVWRAFDSRPQVIATSNRPLVWQTLDIDRRWRCAAGVVEPG